MGKSYQESLLFQLSQLISTRRLIPLGDTGFEPLDLTARGDKELRQSSKSGGTNSGTVNTQFGDFSPNLVTVINAWSTLPETVRQKIVAMVQKTAECKEKITISTENDHRLR